VADDAPEGTMEKSCPAPFRVTACGLPPALSVIISVPVRVPDVDGSKNTPIVQLMLGGTLFVQSLSVPKSTILVVTLEIVKAAAPEFVTVTVCGSPDVPTYCAGKLMLGGDNVTDDCKPMPESGIVCGLLGALSATVTAAVLVPPAVGVKVTVMLQLVVEGRELGQSFVSAKSPLFGPVT
jgi:hypothetical protein